MLRWPKTILQLVFVGLFAAIAPLCIAVFFTLEALDNLSRQSSEISERSLALTRASQSFRSNLFDLERRARLYETLGEENLLVLFIREHENIMSQFDVIASLLDGFDSQDPQLANLQWQLDQKLGVIPHNGEVLKNNLTLFAELNEANQSFQRLTEAYVDLKLREHQEHTEEIKKSLLWTLLLLAVITISAAVFFSYWINKPIKQLEKRIGQLGRGEAMPTASISGPFEMRALGEQLEWLHNRLNELESQKQQFLRHMSHELKTPLASLREGADLMAEGIVGELQQKQREIIEIIQHNSRELQRLIENLLDYNQFLSSREIIAKTVNIRQLWAELLSSYKLSIEHKNIVVSLSGEPDQWHLDYTKIKTTLDNLLSNAVNYAPVNGVIEVSWKAVDGALQIDVANSGEAIPQAEADKIFQPFYQGSASRNGPIKGSGIGLSLARECMEVHGGSLELLPQGRLAVNFRVLCPHLQEEAAA